MRATLPPHKVTDGNATHQTLSRAALGSLDTTIGSHRVELEDGDADWLTLSLENVMTFLIEESPNFKLLMEDVIRRRGGHHAQFRHRYIKCSGDNRSRDSGVQVPIAISFWVPRAQR